MHLPKFLLVIAIAPNFMKLETKCCVLFQMATHPSQKRRERHVALGLCVCVRLCVFAWFIFASAVLFQTVINSD